eukprot:720721-Pelagomonas_calceolata.AAC.1
MRLQNGFSNHRQTINEAPTNESNSTISELGDLESFASALGILWRSRSTVLLSAHYGEAGAMHCSQFT